MRLNINDIPICVINLNTRPERLKRTTEQLNKFFNTDKSFHLIEAVKHKRPMIGIAQSHIKCIELAKLNNWENVFICEDDINFHSNNSYNYAIEAFKNAPEDFDILLSGIYTSYKLSPYSEYWNSVKEFSGTHFYIVNKNAYDKIIDRFDFNAHIDRWYGHERQGQLNCYVVKEFFCIQFVGYSDNVDKEMDYTHLLKKFKLLD